MRTCTPQGSGPRRDAFGVELRVCGEGLGAVDRCGAIVVVVLGAFAPKVEHALAGAGWEASGSESVAARTVVRGEFNGMSSAALQVVVQSRNGPAEHE